MPYNKKIKRIAQTTVYIACEGCREYEFLSHIKDLFNEELKKNAIVLDIDSKKNKFGGDPKVTIGRALLNCEKYEKSIAWLDEDKNLTDKEIIKEVCEKWCIAKPKKIASLQHLKELNIKAKNPIIILSQPLSIESVILATLGKKLPKLNTNLSDTSKVQQLKNHLEDIFGFKDDSKKERRYYKHHITKEKLLSKIPKIASLKEFFDILNIL